MFKDELNIQKEPFKFAYTMPSLDWYENIYVEIEWGEYSAFEIQIRYGPSCWIYGTKYDEMTKQFQHKELGRMDSMVQLAQFIRWCTTKSGFNLIMSIKCIDQTLNLPEWIAKIQKALEKQDGQL